MKPFASRVLFHVCATEYLSSLTFLILPGRQFLQQKQKVSKSDPRMKQIIRFQNPIGVALSGDTECSLAVCQHV